MRKLNKAITVLTVATTVLSLAACSSKKAEEPVETEAPVETTAPVETETPEVTEDVTIANPWVDCETKDEAVELAGFDLILPDGQTEGVAFRVVEGEILEADIGADSDDPVIVRKALGVDLDVSGDYNDYDGGGTIYIGDNEDIHVTYRAEGEDLVHVAFWSIGDYSYSVYSVSGINLDVLEQFVKLVE